MDPLRHPSAVIHEGAVLGTGVRVGPNVVIEDGVQVGDGTVLLTGTVLMTGSRIAAGCTLGPYAVVGGLPMDHDFQGETSFVDIGAGTELREFATVHRATGEGKATVVGAGSLLMSYVHVSHNARVGDRVTLTAGCRLGGHSAVGDGAVLGAGAQLHQFVRVGELAMVGAASGLNRDALPFTLLHGLYAEHYGLNRVGLKRSGIGQERYRLLEAAYRALRRRDRDAFSDLASESHDVRRMQEFMDASRRGISAVRRS